MVTVISLQPDNDHLLWSQLTFHKSCLLSATATSPQRLNPSQLSKYLSQWSVKLLYSHLGCFGYGRADRGCVNLKRKKEKKRRAFARGGSQLKRNAMKREIWIRTTYILKEMASKLAEFLTSIIVLNGFRLKMYTLVGCKMKMKLQVFNRVAQEIESTCRNYWKFESKCEWFRAILYENSKMPYFDRKFLGSGPSFHELVNCKNFFLM